MVIPCNIEGPNLIEFIFFSKENLFKLDWAVVCKGFSFFQCQVIAFSTPGPVVPDSKLTFVFCCLDVPQLIPFAFVLPQILKLNRKDVSFTFSFDCCQIPGILSFFFDRNKVWNSGVLFAVDRMLAAHCSNLNLIIIWIQYKSSF